MFLLSSFDGIHLILGCGLKTETMSVNVIDIQFELLNVMLGYSTVKLTSLFYAIVHHFL